MRRLGWSLLLLSVCFLSLNPARCQGTALVVPQVVDGAGITFELILTNPGEQMNNGVVAFTDTDGKPLGVTVKGQPVSSWNYSLLPGGVARLQTDGLGPVKIGYGEILVDPAPSSISAMAIYNLHGQVSVAGCRPGPAFHVFVENSATRRSGLALVNPSSQAQEISLVLLDASGQLMAETRVTLQPGCQLSRFVDELFSGAPQDFIGSVHAKGVEFAFLGLRQSNDGSLGALGGAPQALGSERRWIEVTGAASFPPRYGHKTIVFKGKLFLIGGKTGDGTSDLGSDVWSSEDGVHFTQVANSQFPARAYPEAVVFDDKLWIIGGRGVGSTILGDVWCSPDGETWTQVSGSAEFGPRWMHSAVVHNGRMWVMAGSAYNGFKGDVWSSADGAHWQLSTASPGFTARASAGCVSFLDRIWLIGGGVSSNIGNLNDVWSSADGVNWTRATGQAAFSGRHAPRVLVWNNEIWLTSGVINGNTSGNSLMVNDLWRSADGANWTQVQTSISYLPRMSPQAVLFNNRLWLSAGGRVNAAETGFDFRNDIWLLF